MGTVKPRIQYVVDDKQLDELLKTLQKIDKSTDEINKNQPDLSKGAKKSNDSLNTLKTSLLQLGGTVAIGALLKEFAALTQEVNKNRKAVAQLTGETGGQLDIVTAKIRATSGAFGKEFNEVLQAANTSAKVFGTTTTEALEEINAGFVRGLDIGGEYLENIKEYSPFIKEAGLSQRQFNVLIQEQINQGVFSDKGIDAVKEAVISIREMTPATKDAIKAVGLSSDELQRDIAAGTITYFEAIQKVVDKTNELNDEAVKGQVLADIFRGAGEDAGDFVFTLGNVGSEFAKATEEQEKYIQKQERLLETSENMNEQLVDFSSNFSAATSNLQIFTNVIATESLKFLNSLLGNFISLGKELDSFNRKIQTLEIDQIKEQIEELSEGPSFFERLGASIGGPGALAEQGAKAASKVAILKQRLEELENPVEENTNDINDNTDAINKNVNALDRQIAARESIGDELTGKGIEENDLQTKIDGDELIKKQEEKLQEDLLQIKENAREIDEEAKQAEFELEQERNDQRLELASNFIAGIGEIFQGFQDLRIQQIQSEIDANELARNRELELAEGNAEKQQEINEKYDQKQRELKTQQVEAEKRAALFQIAINTAIAIAQALPNVALSILAGALGAAQAAFVAAQPLPKFAKGVIDLQGPGTETSDSIPALLSKRESVMTATETIDYKPTLQAIRAREIDPMVLNSFVRNGSKDNIVVNDYDKLAKALISRPEYRTTMDINGFTQYMSNKSMKVQQKASKFRMQ